MPPHPERQEIHAVASIMPKLGCRDYTDHDPMESAVRRPLAAYSSRVMTRIS
jgi:hypothetical protein